MDGAGIGKSLKNHQPLKQAIASLECGFSLISLGYSDQMVSVLDINFCVDVSPGGCIKEVGDEWEWIAILLCYMV